MKMKFLAPPLSLSLLLFGLAYVDAAEVQFELKAPHAVQVTEPISRDGELQLVGYTDFRDACEDYAHHAVQLRDEKVIVNSYIARKVDELCAQQIRADVKKVFTVSALNPNQAYQVFFREADGRLQEIGWVQPQ